MLTLDARSMHGFHAAGNDLASSAALFLLSFDP